MLRTDADPHAGFWEYIDQPEVQTMLREIIEATKDPLPPLPHRGPPTLSSVIDGIKRAAAAWWGR